MFQFNAGESIRVVNPPEHCIYINGYTGTVLRQVNEDRYLVRLDARKGIPMGRWQLYFLPTQALERTNSSSLV